MALDYKGSSDLMNDPVFRGRVKVSLLHYANYIANENQTVPAHNTRYAWAKNTILQPDQTASQYTPPVVMDSAVQQDGAAVTDTALQSAVENIVNQLL
jgi:hypothetical protein